jgi:hypothetical protein
VADIGLSQARQVTNSQHSPAGQTGLPNSTSGNAYGAALDTSTLSGNNEASASSYNQIQNYLIEKITGVHYTQNVSDTVTITDQVATALDARPSLADTLNFTDTVGTQQHFQVNVSDNLNFSDAVDFAARILVSDTITFTDSVAASADLHVGVSDSPTFSDAIAKVLNARPNVSDTLSFSEQLTNFLINFHISTTFTDQVSAQVRYVIVVSDTLTFSDSIGTPQETFAAPPMRYFKMRAACSTAPGGYIYWINNTGDNTNQPGCGGTLGLSYILDEWVK